VVEARQIRPPARDSNLIAQASVLDHANAYMSLTSSNAIVDTPGRAIGFHLGERGETGDTFVASNGTWFRILEIDYDLTGEAARDFTRSRRSSRCVRASPGRLGSRP
jgi:hypothetical protein